MKKEIEWIWVPNQGLGPIKLGCNVSKYDNDFRVELDESISKDVTGLDTYVLPDYDISLDTRNEIIESITAYHYFMYKDKNLIGEPIKSLSRLLGCDPDEIGESVLYDDGDIQTPYEYFDLGLQVWVSDKAHGKTDIITSITCLSYEDV